MAKTAPVMIVAPPGDAHSLVVAARIEARGRECLICRSESDQLFRGVLAGLTLPIYNDPDAEDRASRKAYQLALAAQMGLSIPGTLFTSSPERAREFCSTSGTAAVFKPFTTPAGSMCGTQEYSDAIQDKLSLLNNAPMILQEKVAPFRDIRVSVIGTKVFAGISSSELLDWRMDSGLTWRAHELPAQMQNLVILFLRKLQLTLGHFDFRLTSSNEYVFFEVNPSGQFLFLEIDDHGIEISAALADLLVGQESASESSRKAAASDRSRGELGC